MNRRTFACLFALAAILVGPAAARAASFGVAPGSLAVTARNADGTIDAQASSHPYAFTVSFALNTDLEGHSVGGELRDVLIDLPPGLVGNPTAVPTCTRQEFEGGRPHCSPASQIGILHANIPETGLIAARSTTSSPRRGLPLSSVSAPRA